MRKLFLAAVAGMVLHAQGLEPGQINSLFLTTDLVGVLSHLGREIRKDWKPKPGLLVWSDPSRAHPDQWKAFLERRYPVPNPTGAPIPGAVVEVWGDPSWARQDETRAYFRAYLPAFRTAFFSSYSAGARGDFLLDRVAGGPSSMSPQNWVKVLKASDNASILGRW